MRMYRIIYKFRTFSTFNMYRLPTIRT